MGAMRASASTAIDAPPQRVWEIVADVESWPRWQATLSDVDVEARDADGRPQLCQVVFDAKVQTISTLQRVRYEPPLRLTFEQDRGNLKALRGAWRLEDLGAGRTRATYELEVQAGGVLGMLVKGAVEERLREVLVTRLPGELKARAEAP
ncbi:MAG TPA: SRPBCC family protein [Solirubrobacteraceae bacterium]|jgi:ribosome-associated toxin RatA of RatAB toxin-antitoxin module|nr:SRPBCC family protein [Solirubrobacteraceae bacterium]